MFTGYGFDYQASYLFLNDYEVIGRFSTQKVNNDIRQLAPNTNQYTIGVTKYVWEHSFKAQMELTFDDLNYFDGTSKQNWYLRFQVEMGI